MAESKERRVGPSCGKCSRSLENETSVSLGIGPICRSEIAKKFRDDVGGKIGDTPIDDLCDYSGCFHGYDHFVTVVGRVRTWISNIAEAAGEPLPLQAQKLILLGRMIKIASAFPGEDAVKNSKCPLPRRELELAKFEGLKVTRAQAQELMHYQGPPELNGMTWDLVSWMKHQVEPWLWMRHRDLVREPARCYNHLWNLLELLGHSDEAADVKKDAQRARAGKEHRKRMYRYLKWYPVEEA